MTNSSLLFSPPLLQKFRVLFFLFLMAKPDFGDGFLKEAFLASVRAVFSLSP